MTSVPVTVYASCTNCGAVHPRDGFIEYMAASDSYLLVSTERVAACETCGDYRLTWKPARSNDEQLVG